VTALPGSQKRSTHTARSSETTFPAPVHGWHTFPAKAGALWKVPLRHGTHVDPSVATALPGLQVRGVHAVAPAALIVPAVHASHLSPVNLA
jgi:hypothetical protein